MTPAEELRHAIIEEAKRIYKQPETVQAFETLLDDCAADMLPPGFRHRVSERNKVWHLEVWAEGRNDSA